MRSAAERAVDHWATLYRSILLDLSGGLDSAIVLGLLRRHPRHPDVVGVAEAFRPDPVAQEEAAAMFRADLNLFGKWELTDGRAATLLDMPLRSYRRWKAEVPGRVSRDGAARLSNLMGIHKALRIVFSDAQRGYAWIKAGNSAFAGSSALDVMLGGEHTDIMRVRRYLNAERREGWNPARFRSPVIPSLRIVIGLPHIRSYLESYLTLLIERRRRH